MARRTREASAESAGDAGSGGEGRPHSLREHGREIRTEGEALLEATREALGEMERAAAERVEAHPYTTLGAAFGLGLLLGGGLPFGAVRFGARLAAGVLLRELVESALPSGAPRA